MKAGRRKNPRIGNDTRTVYDTQDGDEAPGPRGRSRTEASGTAPAPAGAPAGHRSLSRLFWALFSLFIVYGTIVPFSFREGGEAFLERLGRFHLDPLGARNGVLNYEDIVQNVLLFIPFGFLGCVSLAGPPGRAARLLIVLLGAALSLSVELAQLYTRTRWPALSDVLFNTLGTAVGVAAGGKLRAWALGIKRRPGWRRILDAPSAYPALVFLALVVFGSWEPFDFALLPVGALRAEARETLARGFDLSWPNDELVTAIRFLLAALFAFRVGAEAGLRRPVRVLLPAMAAACLALEASQMLITSRSPTFQDALTALFGAFAGGVAYLFPGFRDHPWKWSAVAALGVLASSALTGLYPFRYAGERSHIRWIPFRSAYMESTFAALGNFAENSLIYFPLGFLLCHFFPRRRGAAAAAIALALLMSLAVEYAQGFVAGRRSDLTDVVAAAVGAWLGCLAWSRGWQAYREYTA